MTTSLPRPFPAALAVVAAVALIAGLDAGAADRGLLGTGTSPCFIALPVASGRGSLAGIGLVDVLPGPWLAQRGVSA
jgi:hypothetical protein